MENMTKHSYDHFNISNYGNTLNFQYSCYLKEVVSSKFIYKALKFKPFTSNLFCKILQLSRSSCSCKVSQSSWTSWLHGSQLRELSLTEDYKFPNTLYIILACWWCFGLLRIPVLQRSFYGSSLS